MGMYETLTKAGVSEVEIEYYGSGDEGYVESVTLLAANGSEITNADASREVEEFVYDKLPGGFEINEGSQGNVKIDVVGRKAYFDHYENETVSHHSPFEVEDNG